VELAVWCQVDNKLEALQTLAALIWDLVLGSVGGPSSLAASVCIVAELLEGQIDTAAADGVRWGARSTLGAALSRISRTEV
jgi:hypothetical protein